MEGDSGSRRHRGGAIVRAYFGNIQPIKNSDQSVPADDRATRNRAFLSTMNDLYKLTATDAVALLKNRDVSPLDLVEASIERIDMTDAKLNAMVTRCHERARDHAVRKRDIVLAE